MLALTVFVILLALAFDFINGMNDAVNSIATVVSTRVLSPKAAVVWAAFFNFVAAFGFGVHVATTIGKGIVGVGATKRLSAIRWGIAGRTIWAQTSRFLCLTQHVMKEQVGCLLEKPGPPHPGHLE